MCFELDKVASEVKKVENWLFHCHEFGANIGSLTSRLVQICFVSNFYVIKKCCSVSQVIRILKIKDLLNFDFLCQVHAVDGSSVVC